MSQAARDLPPTIDDVCWELFGGPCGALATKEEMATCSRKIRECDIFVPAFRKATSLLRAASQPAPAPAKTAGKPPAPAAPPASVPAPAPTTSTPAPPSMAPEPIEGGVRFRFQGAAQAVQVAGSFNGWQPAPLEQGPGGAWSLAVKAPAGRHTYKLVVDGNWIRPPEAPGYEADGQGSENGVVTIA